ncbi:MAG: hypothetical protein WBF67_06030, partial [Olleya sp.]
TIVRSNPGVLKLEKGTIIQKVHWNDVDELELPKVERSVTVKKPTHEDTAHLVDDKILNLEEFEDLNLGEEQIENIYVFKNKSAARATLDSINQKTDKNYTSVIKIVTKKKE